MYNIMHLFTYYPNTFSQECKLTAFFIINMPSIMLIFGVLVYFLIKNKKQLLTKLNLFFKFSNLPQIKKILTNFYPVLQYVHKNL